MLVRSILAGSVALLFGLNLWLATSYFAPLLQSPHGLQYIVVLRPFWQLGAAIAISGAIFASALRFSRAAGRAATNAGMAWLLLPLCGPMLVVMALATPLRRYAGPWVFLFIDLYPWLALAGALGLVASVVIEREWMARRVSAVAEMLLPAALAVVALASSPPLRFQSAILGDEPKYLRFAENWYRGQGLNIEHFPDIGQLPRDFRPNLMGNLRAALRALPVIASDAAADAAGVLSGRPQQSEERTGANWFIRGRHGGTYQVHPPGFSLLLFPGYFVDRYLSNGSSRYHPQFPTNLYATNLTVLLLYLGWAVATYRMLRTQSRERLMPWVITAVVMASLPVAAFNYQYYPEAAGGLVLMTTLAYALNGTDRRASIAFAYGCLAGFLPWLHLRFGALTVLLALTAGFAPHRARRTATWFWIGAAVPLALLAVYTYYLSGSLWPWALYDLVEDSPGFSVQRALREAPWLWLDRAWGLLAHAPVYLLAVPGVLLLWRSNRRATLFVAAALVSLSLLAAAHGVTGGRTTPLRLVAAVVPLLALPLAQAAVAFRGSRWAVMAFAVLALVSIHNGVSYNRLLIKHNAVLTGATVGGWKTPLMFSDLEQRTGTTAPAYFWGAATLLLAVAPLLRQRWQRPTQPRLPYALAGVAALAGFALTGSVAAVVTGEGYNTRYLASSEEVRYEVLHAFLGEREAMIWSPGMGKVDVATLFPTAPNATVVLRPTNATVGVGEEVVLTAEALGDDQQMAWGMATIDYGDGTPLHRMPLVGDEWVRHRYAQPGEYTLTVYLAPPRIRTGAQAPGTAGTRQSLAQGSAVVTVTDARKSESSAPARSSARPAVPWR